MIVEETELDGVLVLRPARFTDDRGWFSETWNQNTLINNGINISFVQDNHSYSQNAGTVRGLHYQAPPHAQAKLVRCTAGAILDFAVDARLSSQNYGRHVKVELSAEEGTQLLIPEGFLHGFSTLTDDAEVVYKCSDFYNPDSDGSVLWNSPVLNIDWGLTGDAHLSDKDAAAIDFAQWASPFA